MSARTLFIARLMGLYLLAAAVTMLTHKQAIVGIENTMVHDAALLYLIGLITLAAGLAVVLGHNVWHGGALPVTVTLCGWIMAAKGLMLMLPQVTLAFWADLRFEQLYYVYASISFVLGAYLTLAGFRTHSPHVGFPHPEPR